MTGSELRILRLLFSYNRFTPFTGMTIENIADSSQEQATEFEMKHMKSNMSALSIPTIRRAVKKLIEQGYVADGIKKETYKKTYFISQKGVDLMHEMAEASKEFKKLEEKRK